MWLRSSRVPPKIKPNMTGTHNYRKTVFSGAPGCRRLETISKQVCTWAIYGEVKFSLSFQYLPRPVPVYVDYILST